MELRQLECFAKTAELGSFTKAAQLLHISQPALSKSIALLEDSLGVKLFDRHGKKVTLNATGLSVLEFAQEILDRCNKIYSVCQTAKNEDQSTLALRMMAGSEFLPVILAGFKKLHPEITIISRQNAGSMEQEDADILIYASKKEHRYSTDRSVLCESLALAVPEGHPLYNAETVSFSKIAEYPMVSLRAGNDMRILEEYYFELAGVTPRREVECDVPATLRALIKSGFGISLVPTVTWNITEDSSIRLLSIRDFNCVRYINVTLPHPEKTNPSVEAFYRYLEEFFQGIGTSLEPVCET
jgi:DNA-binding transcriptional LysR family regulator